MSNSKVFEHLLHLHYTPYLALAVKWSLGYFGQEKAKLKIDKVSVDIVSIPLLDIHSKKIRSVFQRDLCVHGTIIQGTQVLETTVSEGMNK